MQDSRVEVERIAVHDFQVLIRKSVAQKLDEAFVFLDCEYAHAFRKRQFSQRSQTGTDLNDVIVWGQIRLVDNPAREVVVVQKILSEGLHWRNADLTQECGNFR